MAESSSLNDGGRLAQLRFEAVGLGTDAENSSQRMHAMFEEAIPGIGVHSRYLRWIDLTEHRFVWNVVVGVPKTLSLGEWRLLGNKATQALLGENACACCEYSAQVVCVLEELDALCRWEQELVARAGVSTGSLLEVRNALALRCNTRRKCKTIFK